MEVLDKEFFDTVRALPGKAYAVGYEVDGAAVGTSYKIPEGSLAKLAGEDTGAAPKTRARRQASRTGGKLPKRAPAKSRAVVKAKTPAVVKAAPAAPVEEPDAPAFGGLDKDAEAHMETFLQETGPLEAIPNLGGDAA